MTDTTDIHARHRTVWRVAAVVAALLLAAAAVDLISVQAGQAPPLRCAIVPMFQMVSMFAAAGLIAIGCVAWLFFRFKRRDVLVLMAAGAIVFTVPLLLNLFLAAAVAFDCD